MKALKETVYYNRHKIENVLAGLPVALVVVAMVAYCVFQVWAGMTNWGTN